MTSSLLAAGNAVQIDWGLLFERIFNGDRVFWGSLWVTVYISVLAELLGIILGIITLASLRSHYFLVRRSAWFYQWIMRGTPPIVQIFFIYYGVNLLFGFNVFPDEVSFLGVTVSGAVIAGIVALGLNEGAFMSEIIRGGVDSIDSGQRESALAVGMTSRQAMRRIVAPQAVRVIIPTIGNQYNYMIKATSLLSFIGVYEMFQDAQAGYAATFQPVEYFIGVAFWYLVLTTLWGIVQSRIEKKLGEPEPEFQGKRTIWKPWKSKVDAAPPSRDLIETPV